MGNIITARAHATTANLGVMFDCGAMAIKELYTDVSISLMDTGYEISLSGYGREHIPVDDNNLAYQAVMEYLKFTGSKLKGFSIHINNRIPFSGGLGSSAASIIATLKAIDMLFSDQLSAMQLLEIALEVEHHGDNLLACLLGGFTLYSECSKVKNSISESLTGVLTIPAYRVSTLTARRVLPVKFSRQDSVSALQNAALLTHGIINGDLSVISQVLENDVIHEPFRHQLNKKLIEVRNSARQHGALGTVISGSGSAIISFVNRENQEKLYLTMKNEFSDCDVIKISFTNDGAHIISI